MGIEAVLAAGNPGTKRRKPGRGLVWAGLASPADLKSRSMRAIGVTAYERRARRNEQREHREAKLKAAAA